MQGASRQALAALRDNVDGAASSSRDLQQLSEDLFAVVSLLAGQTALRRTLSDPAIEAERKAQLVDNLFSAQVGAAALGVLRTAAEQRWSAPRDVVDALEALAVEAALQRAESDGVLDEVEDQLFRFERILDSEHRLREALTDLNLPADRKTRLLHELLDGKVADVSYALIERAVLAPRGRTVERVLDEFTELAAKRRERLIAHVTTAAPLDEAQQERLAEALGREFGQAIRLQVVVDPELIGGLTVRVGDELIDASVLRHLGSAHRKLTGRSRVQT